MSHIETRNPIGSVESAGCDLPFSVLEIFEALRKVSQIEIATVDCFAQNKRDHEIS